MTPFGNPPGRKTALVVSKPAAQGLDLRDLVGMLVGGGYTSLSDEDARNHFSKMQQIMGPAAANSMLVHILKQNQRPEFRNMKPEDRITNFYNIRSSHIPTDETLQSLKAIGTGPTSGYLQSSNLVNQRQQGNANENLLRAIQSGQIAVR